MSLLGFISLRYPLELPSTFAPRLPLPIIHKSPHVFLSRSFSSDSCSPSLSVICKLHCNAQVIVGDDESIESAAFRFRRECYREGLFREIKRRCYFESKREKRIRKSQDAAWRNRKRRPPAKAKEMRRPKKYNNDDDGDDDGNWETNVTDLPYGLSLSSFIGED